MSSLRDLIQTVAGRDADDETFAAREVVVQQNGQARQAGSAHPDGTFVAEFRRRAERSLYLFAKAVLGLTRLTPPLHKPVCDWLQGIPPYRKLLLLPRDHLKSSIVAKALPIHLLIQPAATNAYFPGRDGSATRILLSNETATNAEHFLRWIMAKFETGALLRALWPARMWDNPRKQSRKWNEKECVIPRTDDFPESSIETIGVGGAITSRHYEVLIKDDLISVEAANSEIVMTTAIEWHKASRALLDPPDTALEFTVGTRWAVHDLYDFIIETDPSVAVLKRAVVEDGVPIFPVGGEGVPMFGLPTIDRLQKEFGVLFPLLYMNDATDPSLTDFDLEQLREFEFVGDILRFREDERDAALAERLHAPRPSTQSHLRGLRLTPETWPMVFERGQGYLRVKYS